MSQIVMQYGADHDDREAWCRILPAFRDAVDVGGGIKEIAYRVDVSPSLFSDALHERSNKGVRLSWLPTVLRATTDAARAGLLAEIAATCGYTVQRARVLTPEERLARIESELRAAGPLGEELLRRATR